MIGPRNALWVAGLVLVFGAGCSSGQGYVAGAPVSARDGGAGDGSTPEAGAGDGGASACTAPPTDATAPITAKHDAMRTGWYPDQPGLNPTIVAGSTFGRLFKTQLPLGSSEKVLAQPLVFDGSVFVATEANDIYALDAVTGAVTASRALGPSWDASDVMCADLPLVGITGTPVIDPTTGTAYFFSKTYKSNASAAVWYAHAVDALTLAERPNFPIEIAGTAANDPTISFDPMYQMQRPALLLMGGVVYAAFGPHCDTGPYHGYVIGIGVNGGITTMWATEAGPDGSRGAGIWQSGGGVVSDGPGRILVTTGNGYSNAMIAPIPGSTPPGTLDQSVIRLQVQTDGSLRATDFFTPYDEVALDGADLDLGSSGPTALPDCLGSAAHPHLIIASGKPGDVYLLDRDDLGGFKQGPSQGDAYVSQITANAGLWSTPAVWPGDGGWVYITPKYDKLQALQMGARIDGTPTLTAIGQSTDLFGYFSGSPIVTSDGAVSGSAVVWATLTASAWAEGSLRAYSAVPDSTGVMTLLFEDSYGASAKFQVPGVGDGRIYVATSDGYVVGYGAPIAKTLATTPLDFGTVVEKHSSTLTLLITANEATKITAITSADPTFTVGTPVPALPAALDAGATLSVPVTFTPTAAQEYVSGLDITSSAGSAAAPLTGFGEASTGKLRVNPGAIRFGGIAIGASTTENVILTNEGATALTFVATTPPAAPFDVVGGPAHGQTLAPGDSVTATIDFSPPTEGTFSDMVTFATDANSVSVFVSGTAAMPSILTITPESIDYGGVAPGSTTMGSFLLEDTGGLGLTITKSKPPAQGVFNATTLLPEGTDWPAGSTVTEDVVFQPTSAGEFTDEWVIGSSAGGGTQEVTFKGEAGYGTGLSATYFDGITLSSPTTVQRIDPTIDFTTWGANPPDPAISVPEFSARWTGQVLALYTETYTFVTTSDQGVRLWVDGVELVNDWTSHPKTVDMGTIALVAGQRYDVVVEYYNQTGTSYMTLEWSSPSTPDEIVPSVFLFPTSE